jgi:hypothetical protein
VLAALATVIVTRIVLQHPGQAANSTPGEQASRLAITLTEPAATATGAALVATGHAAEAFVQAAGALAGLAVGLVTAWILLVEVRRTRPVTGGIVTGGRLRVKAAHRAGSYARARPCEHIRRWSRRVGDQDAHTPEGFSRCVTVAGRSCRASSALPG